MELTAKQKAFVDEYLVDLNATQAAIRAGYSRKTARQIGGKNLTREDIQQAIAERLKVIEEKRVADITEIMQHLTSVLRGEVEEEVIVVEGSGEGHSEARSLMKGSSVRDRLKAAELLGRRYGIFTDRVKNDISGELSVTFVDDIE